MARFKLTASHYLITNPPTEWDYKETDRTTGRPIVRKFVVPTLLDNNDPTCFTERDDFGDGMVVVATKFDQAHPRDIILAKPEPTLDMVPLDEEGKKMMAEFIKSRPHPIESLPANGSFADGLLIQLQSEMAKVNSQASAPAQVAGMAELMAAMTTVMKQNAELIATLAKPQTAPATTARR